MLMSIAGQMMEWNRTISFAHKVIVRGPVAVVVVVLVVVQPQGGGVVEQGVHPHIDHVAGVKIHRHPQVKEVRETHRSSRPGLMKLFTISWTRERGWRKVGVFQQVLDRLGIFGQAEEVGLLLCVLNLPAAVGTLPSTSWLSVQKDSQGLQYLPTYLPL